MKSSIAAPFTALETTVIALACGERGRGSPPRGPISALFYRVTAWLNPESRIRGLADPKLEALRIFVNATYRRGGARADDLAAFLAAGFSPAHLGRLAGARRFAL
jgi:hypothetical protein